MGCTLLKKQKDACDQAPFVPISPHQSVSGGLKPMG